MRPMVIRTKMEVNDDFVYLPDVDRKMLNAPWWYFVALFIGILIKVLRIGYAIGEQKK